ncbi:uncharacterized protein [Rutidosis leptorrhynchoides]|uniref:uncharacterized protein n=1 Tax=Rutidosis leptorrhynchoides TaxID=125765 RepID=UPI003A996F12
MEPIPYPQALRIEKAETQRRDFMEMMKQVHVNMPLIQVLKGMPNYGKFFKNILSSKGKYDEVSATFLVEECSAILQKKKMPPIIGVKDERLDFYVREVDKKLNLSSIESFCQIEVMILCQENDLKALLAVDNSVVDQFDKNEDFDVDKEFEMFMKSCDENHFEKACEGIVDKEVCENVLNKLNMVKEVNLDLNVGGNFVGKKALLNPIVEDIVAKVVKPTQVLKKGEQFVLEKVKKKSMQKPVLKEKVNVDNHFVKHQRFKPGGKVLLFNPNLKKSPGRSKSRWHGPFVVKNILEKGFVELIGKGNPFKVHGDRLKPFNDEVKPMGLDDIGFKPP